MLRSSEKLYYSVQDNEVQRERDRERERKRERKKETSRDRGREMQRQRHWTYGLAVKIRKDSQHVNSRVEMMRSASSVGTAWLEIGRFQFPISNLAII